MSSDGKTNSDSGITLATNDPILAQLITEAQEHLTSERMRKAKQGETKYGAFAFLENPTLEMAMDEIVDFMNYAELTYVKLYMLLRANPAFQASPPQPGTFIPNSTLVGVNNEDEAGDDSWPQ